MWGRKSSTRILVVLTLCVCLFGVASADDVERVNIFTKLKDALTSALIGLALLIVVPIAIFWNEVCRARSHTILVPTHTARLTACPLPPPPRRRHFRGATFVSLSAFSSSRSMRSR